MEISFEWFPGDVNDIVVPWKFKSAGFLACYGRGGTTEKRERKERSERGLGSQESSDKCISISADWRGLDGGKIEANGKKRRR